MAPIAPETVYTKTAKGILEIRNKSVKLPRELGLVFLSVDGKSSVADLLPRSGMTSPQLQHAINTLVADGYIKAVSGPARPAPGPAADAGDLDFSSAEAMTKLNMEAASHALAAADAAKRAQAEARAALEAQMRQESEARARALAEARAEAEAEARATAEETARAAVKERERAEMEASAASDANERAEAEARARTAAAAAVRAEAEARVRAEAEERAKALAETKRGAEEEARLEADKRAKNEEQAQARSATEARAREVLEAQLQAMEGVRAHADNPEAHEAEAARARVRELEAEAEQAREAVRATAEAEGRAHEVPQPEMDIADRVRQLNARVQAERRAREEAARHPQEAPPLTDFAATVPPGARWPQLQLGRAGTSAQVQEPPAALDITVEIPGEATASAVAPPVSAEAPPGDFPVVDLDRPQPVASAGPEHVPTALERVMAEMAARANARAKGAEPVQPVEPAARPEPEPEREPELPAASESIEETPAAEKIDPTIDDTDPLNERLNVDRAAHDIMAENAEARRKAEAAQFTHDAMQARRRRAEEVAQKVALAARRKLRKRVLVAAAVVIVAVPLAVAARLQFAPLNGYIPEAQRALSQRLNQPVAITTLRYVLLPSPRIVLEGVTIGKTSGVRAERVAARVLPIAALAGASSFDTVEAHGVDIEHDVLGTIPAWTGGRTAGAVHTDRLLLTEVRLKIPGAELAPLDGNIAFAPNGTLKVATFNNANVKLEITPQADGVRCALNASGWRVPYGPPFEFNELQVRGLVDQTRVAAGEFTGKLAGGTVEGALNARWAEGVALQGDFKMQDVRLQDLAREMEANLTGRGTLRASGRFSMQAQEWSAIAARPQVEAAFVVSRGELGNIDLLRAVQSPGGGAMRGGKTVFETMRGVLQIGGGHYAVRQLQLTSGPLNASGTADVGPGGQLSGRLVAEVASRGARATLLLDGSLQDPQIRR
jgi:hypothetical protein